jgi:hypothetical protein
MRESLLIYIEYRLSGYIILHEIFSWHNDIKIKKVIQGNGPRLLLEPMPKVKRMNPISTKKRKKK